MNYLGGARSIGRAINYRTDGRTARCCLCGSAFSFSVAAIVLLLPPLHSALLLVLLLQLVGTRARLTGNVNLFDRINAVTIGVRAPLQGNVIAGGIQPTPKWGPEFHTTNESVTLYFMSLSWIRNIIFTTQPTSITKNLQRSQYHKQLSSTYTRSENL